MTWYPKSDALGSPLPSGRTPRTTFTSIPLSSLGPVRGWSANKAFPEGPGPDSPIPLGLSFRRTSFGLPRERRVQLATPESVQC